MQRLNLSEESYFKYVRTINETFQILKRTIVPYYYGDNGWMEWLRNLNSTYN